MPNDRPPPDSTAARDCPVCGEPVPWTRYWLRSWLWARWLCPRCGTTLGFDRQRRWLIAPLGGLAGGVGALAWMRVSLLAAIPIYIAVGTASCLLNRVVVCDYRNPRYCASCRHDLAGTLKAGLGRCPECGRNCERKTVGHG